MMGESQITNTPSYKYLGVEFESSGHHKAHMQELKKREGGLRPSLAKIAHHLNNPSVIPLENVLHANLLLPLTYRLIDFPLKFDSWLNIAQTRLHRTIVSLPNSVNQGQIPLEFNLRQQSLNQKGTLGLN